MASITTKQRAARKRNIKVAQSAKSKNKGGKSKYKKAYKSEYKKISKANKGMGTSKDFIRRKAQKAGYKASKSTGIRKMKVYAKGRARKLGMKSSAAQKNFSAGYLRQMRK